MSDHGSREEALDTGQGLVKIADVRRLDLHPGDTLTITVAAQMEPEAWMTATNRIKQWHPDVHVLVLPPGTDVAVVRNAKE